MQYALKPGTILKTDQNTYTIESVLGHGGFGITYKAGCNIRYGNLIVRIVVAIKEMFLEDICWRDDNNAVAYAPPSSSRMEQCKHDFIHEAKRLLNLTEGNNNIVRVNEVFEANNTAYYVMEYLDGQSLHRHVKEHGPMPEGEMLTLMRPMVEAVAYLHQNHITHLDIKPGNVMLSTDADGLPRTVLIDFGLSKHYDANGEATSTIGTTGYSDGYTPPEQYGGIDRFSPESDVYALAATMIYALTGTTPPKSVALSPGAVDEIIPANVSDATRQMLTDALALHRSKRTANGTALLEAMDAAMANAETQMVSLADDLAEAETVDEGETRMLDINNLPEEPAKPTPKTPKMKIKVKPSAPPTPAPAPQPDANEKKSSGAKWLLPVIIIVALLLAIGIYFGLTAQKKNGSRHTTDSELAETADTADEFVDPRDIIDSATYINTFLRQADAALEIDSAARAVDYLQQAIDFGSAEAKGRLGKMYAEGKGVKKDVDRARTLLKEAVDKGYAEAQATLDKLNAPTPAPAKPKKKTTSSKSARSSANYGDEKIPVSK